MRIENPERSIDFPKITGSCYMKKLQPFLIHPVLLTLSSYLSSFSSIEILFCTLYDPPEALVIILSLFSFFESISSYFRPITRI